MLDPDIRLQKCPDYRQVAWMHKLCCKNAGPHAAVRLKSHHTRTPDVGIGIRVLVPSPREMTEYYGEYLGHGVSKAAFELHCPAANATEHGLRLLSSGPESAMQHRIGSHPLQRTANAAFTAGSQIAPFR